MTDRLERILATIEERDGSLGTFVHVDSEAARAEIASARGPLAGEVVAVKDNIAVAGAPWACS